MAAYFVRRKVKLYFEFALRATEAYGYEQEVLSSFLANDCKERTGVKRYVAI